MSFTCGTPRRLSRIVAGACVGVTVVVVGCAARAPGMMQASGAPGAVEARLGWWLIAVASGVTTTVAVLLVAGILRHRGEAAAAPPPLAGRRVVSGLRWIYVGTGLTIAVLVAVFVGTMRTLTAAAHPPTRPALTLEIVGHQWWWEVRYTDSLPGNAFVTANEIHVPVGRPVRLRLRTVDVLHSFWIPALAGKTDLVDGQVNEAWLRADRPGRFYGQCAEFCGLQHARMAAYVVADSPARFAAWTAGQRREATPPSDSLARIGAVVFRRSCGACHAVRGSDALGHLGPDLTHLATRATIAAGTLPNTTANLAGWIADAQHVKPGSRMPTLALASADLVAVVSYLQQLR